MKNRQTHWAWALPGILSFIFMLLALIFKSLRLSRGSNASAVLLGVGVPIVVGVGIVIVPVVIIVKLGNKRYRRAMVDLQSRYPHVYYAVDFRYGPRLLVADTQTVSIWRARRKGLQQETSWQRGAVPIEQASVPISRAVTAPGIVFTDPGGKRRRMAVSDRITARIQPLEYDSFLPFIQ